MFTAIACLSIAIGEWELKPDQGQAPIGYVEIIGVEPEQFDAAAWEAGTLNLVPDYQHPYIAPRLEGGYRNIYAPSAVFTWDGWRIFYGAWDGSSKPNDRIYMLETNLIDHRARRVVIENGGFIHACNVNALELGDEYELVCTVYPDAGGMNKPAYFRVPKGQTTAITATEDHIIRVEDYPNWDGADVNGMNVIYREDESLYLYFCDFKNFGKVYRAKQRSDRVFEFEGPVLDGAYNVNDVKRVGEHVLMGMHRNRDGLWYAISQSSDSFDDVKPLLKPLGEEDNYIVAMGWVVAHSQVLGVLYGAGPVPELNRNQIFARWIQRKVVFTTSDGEEIAGEWAIGPGRVIVPLPEGNHEGTITVYESDGKTLAGRIDNITLTTGRTYTLLRDGISK